MRKGKKAVHAEQLRIAYRKQAVSMETVVGFAQVERTIAALADKFPAPDKECSQLLWAAHMNGLKAQAEEVVVREIVYQ